MNKSETDWTKMSILGYCGWKYSLARPENHFKTNKSKFNKHYKPFTFLDSYHVHAKRAAKRILNLNDFKSVGLYKIALSAAKPFLMVT